MGSGPAASQAQKSILVSSTTSTEQSGLFAHLLPAFKKASGLDVKVVALGTGQSIHAGELPQNGDHRFTRIEPLPPKEIPVKRTKVDAFVLVKLFLLLPHAGAIEEKPFKTMT